MGMPVNEKEIERLSMERYSCTHDGWLPGEHAIYTEKIL
jgi:hypothetical protein